MFVHVGFYFLESPVSSTLPGSVGDSREQLLFQLLSLTTVELLAFSPKYPEAEIEYTVTIMTTKAFKGGSSAAASFNVLSIHRQDEVRNVCAFLNYPNDHC